MGALDDEAAKQAAERADLDGRTAEFNRLQAEIRRRKEAALAEAVPDFLTRMDRRGNPGLRTFEIATYRDALWGGRRGGLHGGGPWMPKQKRKVTGHVSGWVLRWETFLGDLGHHCILTVDGKLLVHFTGDRDARPHQLLDTTDRDNDPETYLIPTMVKLLKEHGAL